MEDLLPVEYLHVVFTLPAQIADIAHQNKVADYGLLFNASFQTLLAIAVDTKLFGAKIRDPSARSADTEASDQGILLGSFRVNTVLSASHATAPSPNRTSPYVILRSAERSSILRDWQMRNYCLVSGYESRIFASDGWRFVSLGGDCDVFYHAMRQRHGPRTMTAMTPEEAVSYVLANEPAFAVEPTVIRGVTFKAFKNIPPNVPALMAAGWERHGNGALEYLVYEDDRLTYAQFCENVHRMAHAMRDDLGLGQGDRVAIAMRNYPELLTMVLAISSIGATVVFLNAWWTTEELEYALKDSQAKVVFADGPRVQRLAPIKDALGLTIVGVRDGEALGDHSFTTLKDGAKSMDAVGVTIDTDDDFAVMYSSGTTGHPKGVVQTHRGAVNAVFSWLLQSVIAPMVTPPEPGAPEAPRPSALVVTPLFHVTATHPLFLLSLPAGAKITLMHKWDADEAVRLMKENNITRFLGVPTQSAELMMAAKRMGETLPLMDYLGSGGAKRPAAQVAQLAETFPNAGIATGWGMTETNALGIGMIGDDYKLRPESAGKLHPPVQELRMLDDAGNDVPNGTLGEITVKSPANMRCYLNKPEATAETMQEGWLRTGDLGVRDDDGYVTILDRKKNIIIRGGENIACLDVEGALHRLPQVLEACAFSVPDDRLGESVGAVVQLAEGATLTQAQMVDALRDHLAGFKIPHHLWVQSGPLMRGATDKIDRRGLRTACLDTMEKRV